MCEKLKGIINKYIKNKKLFVWACVSFFVCLLSGILSCIFMLYIGRFAAITCLFFFIITLVLFFILFYISLYSKKEIELNKQVNKMEASEIQRRNEKYLSEKNKDIQIFSITQKQSSIKQEQKPIECKPRAYDEYKKLDTVFNYKIEHVTMLMNSETCNNVVEKFYALNPNERLNDLYMYCIQKEYSEDLDDYELCCEEHIVDYTYNKMKKMISEHDIYGVRFDVVALMAKVVNFYFNCRIDFGKLPDDSSIFVNEYFDLEDFDLHNRDSGIHSINTLYYGLLSKGTLKNVPIEDFYAFVQIKIDQLNYGELLNMSYIIGIDLDKECKNFVNLVGKIDKSFFDSYIELDDTITEKFDNKFHNYLRDNPLNSVYEILDGLYHNNVKEIKYFLTVFTQKALCCSYKYALRLSEIMVSSYEENKQVDKEFDILIGKSAKEEMLSRLIGAVNVRIKDNINNKIK